MKKFILAFYKESDYDKGGCNHYYEESDFDLLELNTIEEVCEKIKYYATLNKNINQFNPHYGMTLFYKGGRIMNRCEYTDNCLPDEITIHVFPSRFVCDILSKWEEDYDIEECDMEAFNVCKELLKMIIEEK